VCHLLMAQYSVPRISIRTYQRMTCFHSIGPANHSISPKIFPYDPATYRFASPEPLDIVHVIAPTPEIIGLPPLMTRSFPVPVPLTNTLLSSFMKLCIVKQNLIYSSRQLKIICSLGGKCR
jgi:hypothetical protein